MVAIHVPRPSGEWAPSPTHPLDGAPRPRPRAPVARPARRLPDRATRVRRRRLALLFTLVVTVVLAVGAARFVGGLVSIGATPGPEPVDVPTGAGRPAPVAGADHVVRPGDTLWSIAGRIAPDEDPRVVVDALEAANGGVDLQVGEHLELDLG